VIGSVEDFQNIRHKGRSVGHPFVVPARPPDLFDHAKHLLDSANVGEPQASSLWAGPWCGREWRSLERPAKAWKKGQALKTGLNGNHSANEVVHISLKSSLLIQSREPSIHSAKTRRLFRLLSGSAIIVAISLLTISRNRSPTVHLIFIAI
jgi:hypothetical protein